MSAGSILKDVSLGRYRIRMRLSPMARRNGAELVTSAADKTSLVKKTTGQDRRTGYIKRRLVHAMFPIGWLEEKTPRISTWV